MNIESLTRPEILALTGGPTVADLHAFESLPDDVQQLARRVLGAAAVPDPNAIKAYRQGWEDGCDDMRDRIEIYAPAPPNDERVAKRLGKASA